MQDALAVLDIGKTNLKLSLLDAAGNTLAERRRPNQVLHGAPHRYAQHDVDGIWAWLLVTLRDFSTLAAITAIVPITHGATAALVDERGLVLPVLDYEFALDLQLDADYEALRPPFAETFSPSLPTGLNLGRQLYWLARSYPAEFARARHILAYPQYWAWRLCGVAATEVTSMGCHTDLWQPLAGRRSSLVDRLQWNVLLPPQYPAWAVLGTVHPALAAEANVAPGCQILCGMHDSNASLLRYVCDPDPGHNAPRTVLSTGTWVIAAALDGDLGNLQESADMLANVDVLGQAVACTRFMGGREFAELAGAAVVAEICTVADLQLLIDQGTLALPCFAATGGPFYGRSGSIVGKQPQTARQRYALATLYCVLMTDYCLDALHAEGALVIEGSFTGNPHFAALLAALRPLQTVFVSDDSSGTTYGGWLLRHWGRQRETARQAIAPLALAGWERYRNAWRERCTQTLGA
jgi:sugar (pentulose or hexulose) kinase